jgi:hypothetical protein
LSRFQILNLDAKHYGAFGQLMMYIFWHFSKKQLLQKEDAVKKVLQ